LLRLASAHGWRITRKITLPADQVRAIGRKLGGPLRSVENVFVAAGSQRDRINFLQARDAAAAERVLAGLRRIHRDDFRVGRRGTLVVELSRCAPQRCHLMKQALGLLDRDVRRYRVELELALLERGDQARVNRAFVRFLRAVPAAGSGDGVGGGEGQGTAKGTGKGAGKGTGT